MQEANLNPQNYDYYYTNYEETTIIIYNNSYNQ